MLKKIELLFVKTHDVIDQLDGDETNVFQKSLIDRYKHRPEQLRSMCLAEFAATYCTSYYTKDDEVNNDVLPNTETQTSAKKITLAGGYGQMHEHRKPAVIRFRKV